MNRTAAALAALLLLVAGTTGPVGGSPAVAAGAADTASQTGTSTPSPNESSAPGAVLAGAVDVQEAEVESDLEGRAFGISIARAASNGSKAAVVADEVRELERRTEALRDRKQSLIEARQNGSISEARYRAEMAALVARIDAVERQLNRTESASNDVPAGLLESRGVNATAIATIRNDSRALAGPEVSAIARSIAGPRGGGLGVGSSAGPGLGNGGPPGDGDVPPRGTATASPDRPTPGGQPGGPAGTNTTRSSGPGTNAPVTNPGQGDGNDGGSDGPGGPPG